jgi:NADH-ubiquinone oxidoreductase chain 2
MFILLLSCVILLLTSFFPRKPWVKEYSKLGRLMFSKLIYCEDNILNKMSKQFRIIEYSLIILFILSGALFLICTSDLVSVFLSIELQSYGLYLLSSIYRDSEPATSGGLMYFLLGGLSSCFILLSTGLLYANSGTTNLDNLYVITSISSVSKENMSGLLYWYKSYYIHISMLIMSIGFLFKVSAAPFHFWSPDVYDSIPTIVTTFVAIIAKISIFIFFLELVHYTSKSILDVDFSWTMSLILSSLLSLIIGSVLGLTQKRIKRLFAYSTISHVGFILLGLSIHSIESIQGFMFYLMQYSISNLNAFFLLITIGYSLYFYVDIINSNIATQKSTLISRNNSTNESDKLSIHENTGENPNLQDINNSPIQLISQLKGYYYVNPMLSLSFTITLFSFIGIPPLIGFFGKQIILSSALDSGYVFMSLVAILTSVISAVYYLVIIKQMFFNKPDYDLNPKLKNFYITGLIVEKETIIDRVNIKIPNFVISSSLSLPISVLTLVIGLFIFIPQEWLNMTNILSLILFNI